MKTKLALLLATALLIPLAGECAPPTQDRQGPNGYQPDGYQDMTHVIVYRAPDQVPNVVIGCVGSYGFMATLKSSSDTKAPSLVRFPEYDKTCAT